MKNLSKNLNQIQTKEITREMSESYLDYAMSVIISRALPDVRDGLKPVQRRILYAMYEMGLTSGAKFRKAATTVGEVLGKFHPHGDQAVYDAVIRMAQDFSLRYPLVQGQGNFGCFTKDTKVRLCDGRNLSFEELIKEQKEGKRHWTFTFNHQTGEAEITEIKNPRLTRKNEKIIEIVLDNGEKIKCTLDHQFMLRDGSYKEAKDLKPGDSLMALVKISQNKKSTFWTDSLETADSTKTLELSPNLLYHKSDYNHKVVKTRILQKREDVYDLTTNPWHNFVLAAGVFVHNSIDGDPPAAMRYTEARLSKIGGEMLKDIEKNTVDFTDNYDGTRKEPVVLPSPFPQLLINGALGIAVGMATSIPPHNLSEVLDALIYLLSHPKAETPELFQFIKGPDFPTGGEIFDQKAIIKVYSQGKGPILTRGKAEIVETKRGFQIVIKEIPFQIQKSALLSQIANLIQEKRIEKIRDVRDESDKEGMRIVIDLKPDAIPQKILNQLYKFTDLQKTFHLNMIALVDGIQPKLLNLVEILNYFLLHKKEVVLRRTRYELIKTKERNHILEGLAKCLGRIDEVIKIIKGSSNREEAQKTLEKRFKLTQIQANAILETKLASLAKLEIKKIKDELKETRLKIKELTEILKSPQKVKKIIEKEFKELKKNFGDERKTKVYPQKIGELSEKDLIPEEEAFITLTKTGYIKRIAPEIYKSQQRGGKGILGMKIGGEDEVEHFLIANLHDNLFFFTDSGKVFKTLAYEIPEGKRTSGGRGIFNFLEISPQEKILSILPFGKKDESLGIKYWMMITKNGIIKKTEVSEFENIRRTGLLVLSLKKGDLLRTVQKTTGEDEIVLVTKKGMSIRFKESKIRPMGRKSIGIKAINLKENDEVIGMDVIREKQIADEKKQCLLVVTENGYSKKTKLSQYRLQAKGGRGIKTTRITQKTGKIVFSKVLEKEEDLVVISQKGKVIRTKISFIPLMGRVTQGVRIMKLDKDDKIASAICF